MNPDTVLQETENRPNKHEQKHLKKQQKKKIPSHCAHQPR